MIVSEGAIQFVSRINVSLFAPDCEHMRNYNCFDYQKYDFCEMNLWLRAFDRLSPYLKQLIFQIDEGKDLHHGQYSLKFHNGHIKRLSHQNKVQFLDILDKCYARGTLNSAATRVHVPEPRSYGALENRRIKDFEAAVLDSESCSGATSAALRSEGTAPDPAQADGYQLVVDKSGTCTRSEPDEEDHALLGFLMAYSLNIFSEE